VTNRQVDPTTADKTVDLNRPVLLRRLCSRVRRIAQAPYLDLRVPDTDSPYLDMQAGAGWAVSYSKSRELGGPVVVGIQHCGTGTVGRRAIGDASNTAPKFQLGDGLLSYTRPGVGIVEDLATRRVTKWRLPGGGSLNHTRRDLFASMPISGADWRVHRASIPRVQHHRRR
jgi:hypothetical protein